MSIFITRRIPEPALDMLRAEGVAFRIGQEDDEQGLGREELRLGIEQCDVLLCLLTESIDAGLIAANPRLRGIANMAVGYDNIDVAAATRRGLPVSNTPGVLTEATADLTWALLLAVARRIPEAHTYTVADRYRIWGPNLLLGADVGPGPDGRQKVLGIVGFGRIGEAVARRAVGFDMRILAYDPARDPARDPAAVAELAEFAELDDLLAQSDFVSVHAPLSEATRHLIGEPELRAMRGGAFLINTARGPIVDERALVRALRDGWIAGAGLDVYEDEPALAPGLAELPNVVLLPHIGSASRDTRARMATMAATNALRHLCRQRAPHTINPEVYEMVP